MNRQSNQLTTTRLIIMFVAGIGAGILLLLGVNYLIQNGFPKLGDITETRSSALSAVSYADVYRMQGRRVQVKGYVVLQREADNVCGALGWSNCKVWFSDDPFTSGLGIHEVKIDVGTGSNSITTQGDLYDRSGNHLHIIKSDQFRWYHVTITGYVESCKGRGCVISVDGISSLP